MPRALPVALLLGLMFVPAVHPAADAPRKTQDRDYGTDDPGLHLGEVRTPTDGDFDIRAEAVPGPAVRLSFPDLSAHRYVIYRRGNDSLYRKVGISRSLEWLDDRPDSGTNTYVVIALLRKERNLWVQRTSRPAAAVLPEPAPAAETELIVTTEPPGAIVVLDNRNLGPAPVTVRLKPGTYSLSVSKEGFLPFKSAGFGLGASPTGIRRTNIVLKPVTASLRIETSPPAGRILLDNQPRGEAPLTIPNLPAGSYKIVATLPGHLPAEQTVIVDSPEPRTVLLQLRQQSGRIRVLSDPPGAMAFLDNTPRGPTPVLLSNIPTGPHHVLVRLEGYNSAEAMVTVSADETKEVLLNLSREESLLTVITVPEGAECLLDNAPIGPTPLRRVRIPAGPHLLSLKKTDYLTYEEIIEAKPDQPLVREIVLTPLKATLSVQSVPEAALVILNGNAVGLTPFLSDHIPAGPVHIVVTKPGYMPRTNRLNLQAGTRRDITVQLRPLPETLSPPPVSNGYLSIESQPTGAQVRISGRPAGATPLLVPLAPGTYAVEVVRPGYEVWTSAVVIEQGKSRTVTARLDPVLCTLKVDSVPSQAEVELNGVRMGQTPIAFDLKSGSYVLRVRKEGFSVWSENLVVPEGVRSLSRLVILTQASTSFFFRTSPPGASTYLNDRLIGVTPFRTPRLADGTYHLLYRLEGYRDWTATVQISGGQPSSFQAVLQPLAGGLLVLAEPAEAVVLVDSGQSGPQGATVRNIPPGYRRVVVRAFGHYDHVAQVLIEDGKTTTNRVRLEPRPRGRVVIDSIPPGAGVRIEGRPVGTTPLSVEWPEGTYQLSLHKRGYRTFFARILVQADGTTVFTGRLVEGSDCCLCNTWFGRPQFWYASSLIAFSAAGYAWYREDTLRKAGRTAEADGWRSWSRGLAATGAATLAVGLVVHLAY